PSAGRADIARITHAASADEQSVIDDIRVHVLRLPSDHVDAALRALRRSPLVLFAERDAIVKPQEILPADPYFLNSDSWNLSGGAWGWYQTHTTQAWD